MQLLAYQVTTEPQTEPFTVADAKLRLEIEGAEDDSYITDLIVAARQAAENYTNRAFFTQTVKQSFDGFPNQTKYRPKSEFILAKNQVQSIVSITYTDKDGNEQTMDTTAVNANYHLDNLAEPGRLWLKNGKSNPEISPGTKVVVEYLAGWDDIQKIPAVVKQAMVFWMREAYDNIGNPPAQKVTAFERALSPYRIEYI